MRIISGTSKGRRLQAPKGQRLRPTSDRVKESLFGILGKEVEGKAILDLFAGTGALGIEALSRGAKRVLFVEKGWEALRLIRKNLSQCAMEAQSEVLPVSVEKGIQILEERGDSFDILLLDPPYERGLIEKILKRLRVLKIYHDDSILVIEHHRHEPLPEPLEGWELIRQRRVGDTLVSFLIPRRKP